jgi:hypothetical protein
LEERRSLVGFAASSRTLRQALLFIYKLVVRHLKKTVLMKIFRLKLILVLALFTFSACKKVKRKMIVAKEKTEMKINKNSEKLMQKVFPTFDFEKSDTENNKLRFKEYLDIELTKDVDSIYCFDDAIGIDSDYMFSFNCNELTSKKIIEKHKLTLDKINLDNGFALQHEFNWWNKEKISELDKYSWNNGNGYSKYYWYDNENETAYYFEFST